MTIISRPFPSGWKLSWGIVDQVVISAANFAMMLVLARALGPTDFGVFGLVFLTIMLTVTVQGAMICQPHNVRGAVLRGRQYVDFTTSTAANQIVFMCGTAVLLLLGFGVAHRIGWEYDSLLLALIPTTIFFEWQEFNRRVFYTEDRLRDAAMNDAMSYLSQTLILSVLWLVQRLNSVESALITMAATSAVAAILGTWSLRSSFRGRVNASIVKENWRFGRLLGAAAIAGFLSSQMYVFLAGLFVGPVAVATMRAAESAMRPVGVMLNFVDSVLPIQFKRALSIEMPDQFKNLFKRAAILVSVPLICYCVALAAFGPAIMSALYGKAYGNERWVPVLFAVYYLLSGLSRVVSSGLRALERGGTILIASLVSLVLALSIGWLLVKNAGIYGAMAGILATGILSFAYQWLRLKEDVFTSSTRVPASFEGLTAD